MNPQFQLGEFLPYQINRLAEQVSASLARVYVARFSLTVAQWRILATLHELPGLSASAISRRCHLDKVKVSRAVADLAQRELIARRTSADDGRASELRLTDAGAALFAEVAPLALDWQRRLLAGFSAREQQNLQRLLGRLEDAVAAAEARERPGAMAPAD